MIKTLETVVIACGKFVLSLRNNDMVAEDKDEQLGAHFSTRADRESRAIGVNILHTVYPIEVIIAEEQQNNPLIPENCTVFDPLDGTSNYYAGLDDFGVTACTFRDGQPLYGATYFPVRDLLISAIRGHGCYVGGVGTGIGLPHGIRWRGPLDKTQICTDLGPWAQKNHTFDTVLRPLSQRFNTTSPMAAVEGGRRVLFGHAGAYYNLGVAKIWDAAAMALCVIEVGGIACSPTGGPINWDTINCDWILAANQELADIVVEHSRLWPGRTTMDMLQRSAPEAKHS